MKTAEEYLRNKGLITKEGKLGMFQTEYDAAVICETLMQYATEYANQSKWISVEDRLPEIGERVLVLGWSNTDYRYDSSVYNNDNEANQYIVVWDCENAATVDEIDDGAFCGNYQYIYIDNITHWMKLPEKP